MTSQALLHRDDDTVIVTTPAAGYVSGQVVELQDGRAGVVQGLKALVSGQPAALRTEGVWQSNKAALVILRGCQLYWDIVNFVVTPLRSVTGANFPCGVALADAASTDTSVIWEINERPNYLIDVHRDPFATLFVKTVVGSTTVEVPRLVAMGGAEAMLLGTTAEAQKVDLLSLYSIPVTRPFIVEGRVAIYDIGSGAALDINVGIASATHATDADAIAEHCFLHLDGTSLEVNAQSKDGTTTVAAADTLVLAVDDTYFQFAMDARDLTNVKLYINGVRVLAASTFRLDHATGPLKLLAHMEKTADATPGDFRVAELTARCTDLAA